MDAMVASAFPRGGVASAAGTPPRRQQPGHVPVVRAVGGPPDGTAQLGSELFGVDPVGHDITVTSCWCHVKRHTDVVVTARRARTPRSMGRMGPAPGS